MQAELRNFAFERGIGGKLLLRGSVFNDKHDHGFHPFADGTRVVTSAVQSIELVNNKLYVQTRNTRYLLNV